MTHFLLKTTGKAPKRPKVIRHRSARSIAHAFAKGIEGRGGEDLAKAIRADQNFVQGLQANGFWGFTEIHTGTVHLWRGNASHGQLLFLLAHEIGHIADAHAQKMRRGNLNHELRADLYAWVTDEALRALGRPR